MTLDARALRIPKTRRIATLSLRTGEEVRISVNEDTEPTTMTYDAPCVYDPGDFPPEELSKAMMHEMASMRHFDVFEEAPISSLPPNTVHIAIATRWVHRWKGDSVRSRLVCRGFTETVTDEDQTYASTPLLVVVKLLITVTQLAH